MNVSVCIPTWNGERYLAETLHSVLAQTYREIECLVVDDGSTDRTLDIASSFKDSRIQVHVNPRQLGIANNYNRCLELARGEYICVFQQDDLMMPDNLERKLAVLRVDPTISFVHSSVYWLTAAPGPYATVAQYAPIDRTLDGNKVFRELLLCQNHICNPAVVARRQRMLDVGGYDPEADYTCDYEIWMKMCINQQVGFIADPLVKYRWHDDNSSHRFLTEARRKQLDRARNQAMQLYRRSSGRADAEVLSFALEQVSKAERSAGEIERGNSWLEAQMKNWQKAAEDAIQQFDNAARSWSETEQRLSNELQQCRLELSRVKNSRIRRWASKLRSLLRFRRSVRFR